LISQLFDRCGAELSACHLIKRSVAFGFSHPNAYVCVAERDILAKDPYSIKITLYGLDSFSAIDQCWAALNANLNRFSFMSSDGLIIWRALHAQGINPFFCRISLIGRSINRVYGVYLPTKEGNIHVFVTDPDPVPYVVIKVVHGDLTFASEVEALEIVRPAWYIDCFSHSRQTKLTLPPGEFLAPNITLEAWWKQPSNLPSNFFGGAIFMKHGFTCAKLKEVVRSSSLTVDAVDRDCKLCLRRLHAVGLCHRDVRPQNICLFDDKFELIDFGLVAPADSRMRLSKKSRIQSTWPVDVRDLMLKFKEGADVIAFADTARQVLVHETDNRDESDSDEISFIWTMHDDFEMLSKALVEIFYL
jgi:hypothetical protein